MIRFTAITPANDKRARRTLEGGVRCLAVLAFCLLGTSCRRKPTLLTSTPAGATVWAGDRIIGRTPVSVPHDLVEPVHLRFSLPGCEDLSVPFDPRADYPENRLDVSLEKRTDLTLLCSSDPSGADVYVDGEFRGRTPLQLRHLEPRPVELVFRKSNRKTVTETVDPASLENGTLEVRLPSTTEAYYGRQLAENPQNIHHYVDLAHHYVLEGRFEDAMRVFSEAVAVLVETPGLGNAARLWSEMQRVTDEQYEYGNDQEVKRARIALRETLAQLLGKYPQAPFPHLHLNYILVLDRLNQRRQAQEAFERAWRRFPNNRVLKTLRKKGFAVP